MTLLSGPTHHIVDGGSRALEAAAELSNPLDRARALEDAARCVPDIQHRLRLARAEAIREAIATRSAVSIAAELGISRSRLYKILDVPAAGPAEGGPSPSP